MAIFPILAVYSANLTLVPLQHLVRPLAAALAAALVLQAVLSLVLRDKARGAAAAAALFVWWWSFSWLTPYLEQVGYGMTVPLYVVGAVAVAALASWWRPKALPLNIMGACITGFSALNIAWLILAPGQTTASAASSQASLALPPGPRPDIFHIVLDGFGRTDVLKKQMEVDLSWFDAELEKRGFKIARQARTTFVQTELSVSSTLNMDFLQNLVPEGTEREAGKARLKPLIQEPLVAQKLMASGYRYIAIGTGFDGLWLGRYQLPTRAEGSVSLFEGTLISRTPWGLASGVASSQYDLHREQIKGAFTQLDDLAIPTAKPRFVVAHILAPHPPFVFDEEGGSVRPKGPFGYWDGSDYLTHVGSNSDYQAGYRAKVTYTARRLIQTIDKLQAQGRSPVIILQGDHGSKVGLDQNSLEKTDLQEAFSILYAVSHGPEIDFELPDKDNSVNTYRRLFTAMGAKNLPLKPVTSWYSTAPQPFRFTEVTKQLDAAEAALGS